MKSTDASLESNVKISVPSCVERWAVWRGWCCPPPCPQAIDDKGSRALLRAGGVLTMHSSTGLQNTAFLTSSAAK